MLIGLLLEQPSLRQLIGFDRPRCPSLGRCPDGVLTIVLFNINKDDPFSKSLSSIAVVDGTHCLHRKKLSPFRLPPLPLQRKRIIQMHTEVLIPEPL